MKILYFRRPDNYNIMNGPIRTKNDLMHSLLGLIRLFCVYPISEIRDNKNKADVWICIDEISRCFLINENKIHSFQIPFAVTENDGYLLFSVNGESIDIKMCMILEYITKRLKDRDSSVEMVLDAFFDSIDDFEIIDTKYRENCWQVFVNLMKCEGGYIRYDHDIKNYNMKKHPKDHLDVFYSDNCTFKLGLKKSLDASLFTKIMNNNEDRFFIDI